MRRLRRACTSGSVRSKATFAIFSRSSRHPTAPKPPSSRSRRAIFSRLLLRAEDRADAFSGAVLDDHDHGVTGMQRRVAGRDLEVALRAVDGDHYGVVREVDLGEALAVDWGAFGNSDLNQLHVTLAEEMHRLQHRAVLRGVDVLVEHVEN